MVGKVVDQGTGQGQDADGSRPPDAVDFRVREGFQNKHIKKTQTVRLKDGPQVIKNATLLSIGDPDSDEIKKTTLTLRSYSKKSKAQGGGYDFAAPKNSFALDDEKEIRDLQLLLNEQLLETGIYQALGKDQTRNELSEKILSGEIDAATVASFVDAMANNPDAQAVLAKTPFASALADMVSLDRQRSALDTLAMVAEDPTKNEHDLQRALQDQWWIFGGRFMDIAKRRSFTALEQLDIPLLKPDGCLHIVELKQAHIPNLLIEDHGKAILGKDVHLAVTQAMNYLNAFDEQRAQILLDMSVDSHRAGVTIVVGHSKFIDKAFTAADLGEALRTYNSHLSRIQVITYDELIDSARRSLALV